MPYRTVLYNIIRYGTNYETCSLVSRYVENSKLSTYCSYEGTLNVHVPARAFSMVRVDVFDLLFSSPPKAPEDLPTRFQTKEKGQNHHHCWSEY
jgi:hypothetical protein